MSKGKAKGSGFVRAHFLFEGIVGYRRYMRFKQYLNVISHEEIVQEKLKLIKYLDTYGARATKDAFEVSRSTIYSWKKKYKDSRYDPISLINESKRPKSTRRMIVDERVLSFIRNLRELNYRIGKEKIKVLLDVYCEKESIPKISESLIGKIIKRNNLLFANRIYHNPSVRPTGFRGRHRDRVPKDHKALIPGDLIQIDTVTRFHMNCKVYILTAIDLFSRFTFAFAYTTLSSKVALDFFRKLEVVAPFETSSVKTDNGLEFLGQFDDYLTKQSVTHYFSYPRTPKSNAFIERFNRTIQEEFVDMSLEYFNDIHSFNEKLMDYLVYYNQVRPHKSLKNQAPLGYLVSQDILSNMCVTSTLC